MEFYDREIEAMEREELQKLQLQRLKAQLERIYATSPFYRQKWAQAGVTPDDLHHLEDITRFPVVRKEELRLAQEQFGQFGGYACAEPATWRELHPSSGTTGRPVGTLWTESDVRTITDFTARLMWGQGVRPGDVIQNAFSYGLWVAGMAIHYASHKLGCFVIPTGAATSSDRQIEFLRYWKPTVLFATPSFGIYLTEKLKAQSLRGNGLALRIGSFGGEAGAEVASTRRKLEEALGIDAYDIYGLAEIGPTMAAECERKAGLHWTEDHHLIEVLDPESGHPVPEGEQGVLVITHLTREGTPMVRYWTNDLCRVVRERCSCGRTHARSPGGILGRADDLVIYRGAKFYPAQVEDVVRATPGVADEFRIRLERDVAGAEVCTLVVEPDPAVPRDVELLRRELSEKVRSALGVRLQVHFEPPGSLERTAFKARRVIDLRREVREAG